jgi:hypothetical protein
MFIGHHHPEYRKVRGVMTRYFEINAFVETLSSPECNEYIATLFISGIAQPKLVAVGADSEVKTYREVIFSSSCSGVQYWR